MLLFFKQLFFLISKYLLIFFKNKHWKNNLQTVYEFNLKKKSGLLADESEQNSYY